MILQAYNLKLMQQEFKNIRQSKHPSELSSRFYLGKTIGTGRFGSVRLATRKSKKYAVKTLRKTSRTPTQEVTILRSLDHPNIVKLYEVIEDSENLHLVLEYCSGGELGEYILSKGRVSEEEARQLIKEVLLAVNHIHNCGVIHRDIKPENFLLEGDLKLTDFGLSAVAKEMSEVVGSPYYIAPEVLKGKYDKKCDLWSLGVMLYIMLCGQFPFYGDTNKEVFKKVLKGRVQFKEKPWKSVSSNAKSLIRKLLEVDPAKRYSAKKALANKWFGSFPKPYIPQCAIFSLQSFINFSLLKKKTITLLVKHLNTKSIKELKNIYLSVNTSHSGLITFSELQSALKCSSLTNSQLYSILKGLTCEGSLKFSSFVAGILGCAVLRREWLWEWFEVLENGKGVITDESVQEAFRRQGEDISLSEASQIVEELNPCFPYSFTFSEFKNCFFPKRRSLSSK